MNNHFKTITLKATGAKDLEIKEEIQSLWSGYGSIVRISLKDSPIKSIVAKHVKMPNQKKHPRGWNTDFSHNRKVMSYHVESNWYKIYANKCDDLCKVPNCFIIENNKDETFMALEDMDALGYNKRLNTVNWNEIKVCLKWLANFHATFLNIEPVDLWPIGTYWHLDTRPDELSELTDTTLKNAAPLINTKLNNAKYKTLVHGDAKLANFCFSEDSKKVAAVDFQYVGGGCGMKDVAYFIGSCLYEDECERMEEDILSYYFNELKASIKKRNILEDIDKVESEWRSLYPVAWADFHRFLKGWSPGHWKINSYSERTCRETIEKLSKNSQTPH